ncbi:type II toxin-antitoxin system Phd/YefM family antitoxin [Desulfofustis limnaeus]|jgi:prevent-host-death family protein|uniref:Antitoxin n=1 Tax=Desulfofustis limnaeus TaxID=2740163 RepID=A0ABN6M643_9BACT|nr:type II toxin-antitoxin system Phd/YefM family antitoxin [Desulfofustis limnaeus]MDX9897169.1 type II toxin-antitoxin system Phd/YefM family antitoxin [Desulfofustis sp.]BDD87685.1 antitoxin [Desulfofustis limnaeus]
MGHAWQLQEAKNKFSQLVSCAQQEGPQVVTKHGREAVVVLSYEDYRKIVAKGESLLQFMKRSPLADVELDLARSRDTGRDVEL